LYFNKRKNEAIKYAGIFTGFTIVFLLLIMVFSSGRFFEIFSLCASGGTTPVKFIKAPFNFMNCITGTDTGVLVVFTAGLTAVFFKGRDFFRSQYALYMAVTLVITVFVFGTEGIVGNHLIDIHIASVLALAGVIREYKLDAAVVLKCSAIVIILAFTINAHSLRQISKKEPLLVSVKKTAESLNGVQFFISENPWLPIVMKREVYILDPWMFRIIDNNKPQMLKSFYERLDRGEFDAVIFDQNPHAPWIPEWFDYSHFGGKYMNHLFRNYIFKENFTLYHIYIPGKEHKL